MPAQSLNRLWNRMSLSIIAGFALAPPAVDAATEPVIEPDRSVIASRIPAMESGLESDHLTGDWGGWRSRLVDNGVHLSFGYTGELLGNVTGGLRRGSVYGGLFEAGLDIDTEQANLWPGGAFHLSSIYPHGASISQKHVGDLNAVSNIDAYDSFRLYELWYEQRFWEDRLSIRAGQLVADEEFSTSAPAGSFLNAGFGWPAYISMNTINAGPAYYVAAPGLRLRVQPLDNIYLAAAIFDGDSFDDATGDPRRNASGLRIHINDDQGYFSIYELGYRLNQEETATGLPGEYKIGAWTHTGDFTDLYRDEVGGSAAISGLPGRTHGGNYGLYFAASQMILREEQGSEEGLSIFGRIGGAPGNRNFIKIAVDAGLTYRGLIESRENDTLGFGLIYTRASSDARSFQRDDRDINLTPYSHLVDHETVLEWFYEIQVRKYWTVQPDIQWVIHPGGSGAIPNALVLGLRTSIVF